MSSNPVATVTDPFVSETAKDLFSIQTNSSTSNIVDGNANKHESNEELKSHSASNSCDDANSEALDDDSIGSVAPPEIQITSVPTVDQTASDYEPEEFDPATATPKADSDSPPEPATPTEEGRNIEIVQSFYEACSFSEAAKTAERPENNQDYETEAKPALDSSSVVHDSANDSFTNESGKSEAYPSIGDSFVMVNPGDVTHSSPNANENTAISEETSKSEEPGTSSIRPSIELDESSTEYEYQVSLSNEQVILRINSILIYCFGEIKLKKQSKLKFILS